jgi:hypothetical protein
MTATPARQGFDPAAPAAPQAGQLRENSAPRRGLAAALLAALEYVLLALASPAPGGATGDFIDESWPATGTYSYWGWRHGRHM